MFNKSEYLNALDETLIEMHKLYDSNIFILDELLESKVIFKSIYSEMYNFMKRGFEKREIRTFPIKYKLSKRSKDVFEMEIRHMIVNFKFWYCFMELDKNYKIQKEDIVDAYNINNKMITNFINERLLKQFEVSCDMKTINKTIADLLYRLLQISNDFNEIMGVTINIESFIDVANKNKRFDEIIRTRVDENGQPFEIERMLNDLVDEEVEILKTEDNVLKPILLAGTGIKTQQLREMTINGGFKPDLTGNTVPIPINSNLLVGGFRTITNYYLDSTGGRKALIANAKTMGAAGHFVQLVKLLTTDISLADMDDCGTVHGVKIIMTNKKYLSNMTGRYYRMPYEREYKVLKGDEYDLIGKEIIVRDPTKCAAGYNKICKKCYGEKLYKVNRDISVGGYAAIKITRPLSQNILSTKHLLLTISEEIAFNDEFDKFFTLSANVVMINNQSEVNLEDYRIIINSKNLNVIDDFEENDYNAYTYNIGIQNIKNKDEIYNIVELHGKEMFLSPDFWKNIRVKKEANYFTMNIKDLDDDMELFLIQIENNELTRPLYSIMHILDRKDRGYDLQGRPMIEIDQFVQRFNELLLDAEIDVHFVHASILLYPLIRRVDNPLFRPDFKEYNVDYRIMTTKTALEKHPSVTISLSYQQLKRQLSNIDTYLKTTGSYLDDFYKKTLR